MSSILYKFGTLNYSYSIKLVYIIKSIIITPSIIFITFDLYNSMHKSNASKTVSYDSLSISNNQHSNLAILKRFLFYIIISVALETLLSGLVYIFIRPIFSIFNIEIGVINYAIYAAKILLISSSIIGIQFVISMYFWTIRKFKTSIFLSLTRQLLISIPLMFLFYNMWNLKGILFAIPVADLLSVSICIIFFFTQFKKQKIIS